MSSLDILKDQNINVEALSDLSNIEQAEKIADAFAKISNLNEPLKDEDIIMPSTEDSKPHPLFSPHERRTDFSPHPFPRCHPELVKCS